MYKATDVANYIIESGKVPDLTHLKLQKLMYFVYGIYWREKRHRLFKDSFYAWQYGPVVKSVYNVFKNYKNTTITAPVLQENTTAIGDDDKKIIDIITESMGNSSASELVTMSHLTPPWINAFKDIINDEISTDDIHSYFETAPI